MTSESLSVLATSALHPAARRESSAFVLAAVSLIAFGATGPLAAQESGTPSIAPVIDDATGELDATIVTAGPAPVRAAAPTQTVRRATATRPVEIEIYDTIDTEVIPGGLEDVVRLPGSGYFVATGEIRDQNYVNVNRVLARVPGLYVREEDGAGQFPNISIRGVDGTRAEKITLMEDGILSAPAPYSAPAAYYSPNVARMAGVEILKGSSQIAYGPNTTGGVINYLSTPIPLQEQFYLRSTYGSNATFNAHSHYGNTVETGIGRIGYLAELHYKRSDGFRTLETGNPAFGIPTGNTGYEVIEPMIKLSWEPNTALEQRFEFKYGYTDGDFDETYLGLTAGDLRANPYRRYAGSYLDNIATEQHRTYLKHRVELTDAITVRTAGYYHQFERNWYKIRAVNGAPLHRTLGPTGNPNNLATLQGLRPGVLNYRNNARSYESYGVQTAIDYRVATGGIDHTFTLGWRNHTDSERRQHSDDRITIGGPAPIITDIGVPNGGNRLGQSDANAFWLQDSMEVGRLTVTPGVRYEQVRLSYTDFRNDTTNTVAAAGNGMTDWFVAGVGLNYDLDGTHFLFGGVHEGVSISNPRSILRENVLPEESLSYELGLRRQGSNLNYELVGFITDFSQIISTNAGLGLGNFPTSNAGTADVKGIEFLVSYDPWQDRGVRLPLFLSTTWTSGTLNEALLTGGGEGIYGDGTGGPGIAGADLPYIPEWKVAAGVGLHTDRAGIDLTMTYVSDTFGTGLNSPVPITSSRQGIIDGGVVVDLGAHYYLNDRTKLIGGVHNLFEEVMVTSRIPEGPRVNAPREFYFGLEILWEPGIDALPSGKSLVYK